MISPGNGLLGASDGGGGGVDAAGEAGVGDDADAVSPPKTLPVGFSLGMPPAKRPPNPFGGGRTGAAPGLPPLVVRGEADPLLPATFPEISGADLSTVSTFLSLVPARID